jgi:hypothetical protein
MGEPESWSTCALLSLSIATMSLAVHPAVESRTPTSLRTRLSDARRAALEWATRDRLCA